MAEEKVVYKSEEKQARYEIIKTDFNSCPIKYQIPGKYKKHICFPFHCDCDKYGDTKEDLIKKIATAIRRINVKVNNMEILYISEVGLAKEIVKYLGVK